MSATNQSGGRAAQVRSILQSINESIESLEPLTRSTLLGLQEAKAPMSDDEFEAARSKRFAAKEKRNTGQREKARDKAQSRKDDREAAGEPEKGKASLFKSKKGYEAEKLDLDRKKLKIPDAEREGLKKKDEEPEKETPDSPAARSDDDIAKDVKPELKGFRKSRAKTRDQAFTGKGGKKVGGAAGLQRMAKLRSTGKLPDESGAPEVSQGASIHDKVDALHKMIGELTHHVTKGRESVRSIVTSPGQRRDTQQHPEDDAVSPEDFARHQDLRRGDLGWHERERQRRGTGRSLGARGGSDRDYHGYAGHDREADHEPAALRSKVSKLRRERLKHPGTRDRDHDDAKGHFIRTREKDPESGRVRITGEHPEHKGEPKDGKKSPSWAGHYKDPKSGEVKHGSGDKDNQKFANSTTFGASDDDAMLHTDKDEEGSRGEADDDQFAVVGDTGKDPRHKWYRVSKEGGYASAMASLGKAYRKGGGTKERVVDKVRSTGFVDRKGHQIDIRPTGDLHNQRGKCDGAEGKALKARDAKEHYRLCKGSHDGEGGTKKGRSEYTQGFSPQHDDSSKQKARHKSAESGKKFRRRA